MCRVLAYLGKKASLYDFIYKSDNSIVKQAHRPRTMENLNLAGFGFIAWDASSNNSSIPYYYKDTTLPMYDNNLIQLSKKANVECLIAHVRGADYLSYNEGANNRDLHPFLFPNKKVALAHNGSYPNNSVIREELLRLAKNNYLFMCQGKTDSELIYALFLTQLESLSMQKEKKGEQYYHALIKTFKILKQAKINCNIESPSGLNIFISDGECIVATRYTLDYGQIDSRSNRIQPDYSKLWLTLGSEYAFDENTWGMTGEYKLAKSILIASEPISKDMTSWLEVPEYTVLIAEKRANQVHYQLKDIYV